MDFQIISVDSYSFIKKFLLHYTALHLLELSQVPNCLSFTSKSSELDQARDDDAVVPVVIV